MHLTTLLRVDLSLPFSDPVLIVALAMGLFLLAPFVVQVARLPGIIGIILAGALVGPNALNLLDRDPTIVLLGTVGWDGSRHRTLRIFGSVVDQVLELTRQEVLVARIGRALNTSERIVIIVPEGSDHMEGFAEAARLVKQMAHRLGTSLEVVTVRTAAEPYLDHLRRFRPDAPVRGRAVASWEDLPGHLQETLGEDDLVVVLSARKGAVAWTPELEELPRRLTATRAGGLVIFYPSEMEIPAGAVLDRSPGREAAGAPGAFTSSADPSGRSQGSV